MKQLVLLSLAVLTACGSIVAGPKQGQGGKGKNPKKQTQQNPNKAKTKKPVKKQSVPQCGSMDHVADFSSVLDTQNMSGAEMKRLGKIALKAVGRVMIYAADYLDTHFDMQSPKTQQLFADMEIILGCKNFQKWIDHIQTTLESDRARVIQKTLDKVVKEYSELLSTALVIDAE